MVLEGLIGDIGLFVGLVGNGTQDDKGDFVEVGGVCDGSALHFRAEGMEGIHDVVFLLCGADELVAAHNAASVDADFRDCFLAGFGGCLPQGGIRRKAFEAVRGAHLGDDAGLVAEDSDIHVVVHCIFGDYNVADIDVVVERAGNAGVDQVSDVKAVDQDLRADCSVHLAHTALDDDDVGIVKAPDVELHAGFFNNCIGSHFFRGELFDFKIHSSDNADLHFAL